MTALLLTIFRQNFQGKKSRPIQKIHFEKLKIWTLGFLGFWISLFGFSELQGVNHASGASTTP